MRVRESGTITIFGAELQNELDKDDIAKAAWLLRRYLEYTATILAR
jgi:hypothetical protein